MAKPNVHPFRAFLDRGSDRSQTWAIRRALELGRRISQGHLSGVLSGDGASIDLLQILETVSDGEVSVEEMARWHADRLAAMSPASPPPAHSAA